VWTDEVAEIRRRLNVTL